MQILVLRYSATLTPQGMLGFTLSQLANARHGAVIAVPDSMEFELFEIEGDEVPQILLQDDESGAITYVGGDDDKSA